MKDIPPFLTTEIKWSGEAADEALSLEICLEDVLRATVGKLTEMTRLLKCISTEATTDAEKKTCALLAKEVHRQEIVVTKCLLSSTAAQGLTNDVIRFPYRLERIGDMLENILSGFEKKARDDIQFSSAARAELGVLFDSLLDIMDSLGKAFVAPRADRLNSLISQENNLRETLACYRQAHWERLWSGACLPQASSLYLDILDSIKWANEYLRKITITLLEHENKA
jgi:Na+/phosphate symporter